MPKQKSKKLTKKTSQETQITRQKRRTKQEIFKETVVEKLKENPLISFVAKKVGVGRSTLYRWANEDIIFKDKVIEAQIIGRNMLNDVAISKLMVSIDQGDIRAIIFWLKHNHPDFIDPEKALTNELSRSKGKLSVEQKEGIIKRVKQWKNMCRGKT